MTGTSWTTIATIGIALMGIGDALGIPAPYTAGAIISGAYFGDKLSPMSDTTVLASSIAGADLSHISAICSILPYQASCSAGTLSHHRTLL